MKEHGKVYETQEEAVRRYDNFMTNLAWINQRNTELEHMTVGLNEFADMTEEEFAGIYLHPLNETEFQADVAANAIPQDPNNIPINGKCETAVRNQGQCGSCWAFSASGALDGLLCLSSEENYAWTSPQELVDCTCSGCNGGWPSQALSYYKSKGICKDSEYTYTARKGSCQSSKCKHSGINSVASCQDSGGGVTKALAGNMVSICIDAGGLDFMFYKSGSFMPGVNCNHHSVNHAVLAVSASGGNYRVKNSWGSSWGSGGYFTMPAGTNCLGVNQNPSVYPQ
jgi:xylem cysteine proteinase